jgi:hypothetical protein
MPYTGKLFGLINGKYVELREITGTFDVKITEKDETFEKFWTYYGKIGNRQLTLAQWNKLTSKQIDEIRHNIVEYVTHTDKAFRKGAQSYINPTTEFWNDLVIDRRPEAQVNEGFTPHIDDNREELARLNNEVKEEVFDDLIKELGG